MKIDYKVFDNGTAVIISRQPAIVPIGEEVYIRFKNAPDDVTTAILEIGGKETYRPISAGTCAIPASRLVGEIKVTLAVLDGSARPRIWKCEGLVATPCGGDILLTPNDMNLPERFNELKAENEEIRAEICTLKNSISALNDHMEKMLEGYNLV